MTDQSIFDKLRGAVSKAAPLLGTALGSPLAGIAISLISSVFGGASNDPDDLLKRISADPEAALKLKQLQLTHEKELKQIALDEYQAQLGDLQNARAAKIATEQYTGKKDWIITFLVLAAVGLFGFCLFAAWHTSGSANQIFIYLIGQQSGVYLSVYAFYFSGIDPKKMFDDFKDNSKKSPTLS